MHLVKIVRLLLVAPAYAAVCPLSGPVFPPPRSLSSSTFFQSSLRDLQNTLQATLANNTGPFIASDTFSIQIFSTSDDGKPLFDFHRRGGGLSKDLKLDGDAIYRMASVSKLITSYLLLLQAGDGVWAEKATAHIPELAGKQYWDEITVGALAGYISGVTSELFDNSMLPIGDIRATFPDDFPPLAKNESRGCKYGTNGCSREALLDNILARKPNFLPNTSPVYSNGAFAALGLILESLTGKSFAESLRDLLIQPLGLTGTSTTVPNSTTRSVISADYLPFWWDSDLSDTPSAAMGGLFSTPNDFSAIGRSILSSSLLPANTTRAWLQPTSFTSALTGFVGHGWEIYRHILSAPHNRVVDIYAKAGGFGAYGSHLILIPAYDVGITILKAGTRSDPTPVSNLVTSHLIPALEEAARQEADAVFAGTYAVPGQNSTLVLSTSPGVAGLTVDTWIRNGTDMKSHPLFYSGPDTKLNLYPTNSLGSYSLTGNKGEDEQQSWRLKYIDWVGDGPFDACASWATVDRPTYGLWALDEFVFTVKEGRVSRVRLEAWKEDFVRV